MNIKYSIYKTNESAYISACPKMIISTVWFKLLVNLNYETSELSQTLATSTKFIANKPMPFVLSMIKNIRKSKRGQEIMSFWVFVWVGSGN